MPDATVPGLCVTVHVLTHCSNWKEVGIINILVCCPGEVPVTSQRFFSFMWQHHWAFVKECCLQP